MERGYLVAVLAIVATFAGLSRGLRSIEQWSVLHVHHVGAYAKAECPTSAAKRVIAKVQTRLRPHYAEEAQLLAEMNVPVPPVPPVPPDVAEQVALDSSRISMCARARAMQQAARVRADMLRMQRDMERSARDVRVEPLSLKVQLPADFEQQIQRSTALATRIAADRVKVHVHAFGCNQSTATSSEQ
jgi:hypothetical protein